MGELERLWCVLRVHGWDNFTSTSNLPFPVSITEPDDPEQPSAFLPLFSTREAAEKWAEGKYEVVEVRERELVDEA